MFPTYSLEPWISSLTIVFQSLLYFSPEAPLFCLAKLIFYELPVSFSKYSTLCFLLKAKGILQLPLSFWFVIKILCMHISLDSMLPPKCSSRGCYCHWRWSSSPLKGTWTTLFMWFLPTHLSRVHLSSWQMKILPHMGRLDGTVEWLTLGFSSRHDLRVVRLSPVLGSAI